MRRQQIFVNWNKYLLWLSIIILWCTLSLYKLWVDAERSYNLGGWHLLHDYNRVVFKDLLQTVLIAVIIVAILIFVFHNYNINIIVRIGVIRISSNSIITSKGFKIVKFLSTFVALIVSVYICNSVKLKYADENNIVKLRKKITFEEGGAIVHACGYIESDDGELYNYTNSMEALQNCYDKGNRVSEIDFCQTTDGQLVCSHYFYDLSDDFFSSRKTLTDFKNATVSAGFTTMDLDDLADFMRTHDDFMVITDIKDDNISGCKQIKDKCSDIQDRFIVQIYHFDEFEPIHSMGYDNIILTMYNAQSEERNIDKVVQVACDYDLLAVTIWRESLYGAEQGHPDVQASWLEGDTFFKTMISNNIPLYVHTVNDKNEISHSIALGCSGVYTDNVNNAWMKSLVAE